jgi:hypothetical protein
MKTAVEWLMNKIENVKIIDEYELIKLKESYEQAKEMEKEQIMDAFNQGYREAELNLNNIVNKGDISEFYDAQNYYNETFKQEQ